MFGFFGTNVNVAPPISVKVALLATVIVHSSWVYAISTNFHSRDIFSVREVGAYSESHHVQSRVLEQHQILIFINPFCPWCQKSLDNLSEFKKKNPGWKVGIYVMATIKGFKEFLRRELLNLPLNLEYTLDFHNAIADSYGIDKTPTYIIIDHGQTRKIEGYVDFGRFNFNDNP